MKNKFLLLGLSMLVLSCSDEGGDNVNPTTPPESSTFVTPKSPVNAQDGENKVLMLKVDALTHAFEGGKELTFDAATSFSIMAEQDMEGDFGTIALKYAELDQQIFKGSWVWAGGPGEMTFPESLDGTDAFPVMEDAVEEPAEDDFQYIQLSENFHYDLEAMFPGFEASDLWQAIDNLEAVKEYRVSNPEAKVTLFLYMPSVGIGDPAEWDWFVILKN